MSLPSPPLFPRHAVVSVLEMPLSAFACRDAATARQADRITLPSARHQKMRPDWPLPAPPQVRDKLKCNCAPVQIPMGLEDQLEARKQPSPRLFTSLILPRVLSVCARVAAC